MKFILKPVWIFLVVVSLINNPTFAQVVSPYSLSPKWKFGGFLGGAGLDFPTGNFPTSGAPSTATNPATDGIEASTAISDRAGAMALYSNTMQVRNVLNNTIRNLATDNTCAGSATGGATAIPDPASPDDTYYLFLANDLTGGTCGGKGINYYKFKKNGSGNVVYLSGPVNLAAGADVDESITAGNDGKGNYWIISHSLGSNTFKVWSVTSSGITALADQLVTPSNAFVNAANQSYIKLSPCQNKIAWSGATNAVVYDFNRTTGSIGSLIRSANTGGHGVGLEFSPDGSTIYTSGEGSIDGTIKWFDLKPPFTASGSLAGTTSWSMQIGPDGKIYTSGDQLSTIVGVIQDPNNPSTTSYTTITLPSGNMYRGIINLAWLSPELPVIDTAVTACTVNLSFEFKNYFLTNVGIDPASIVWDFGDGSPTSNVASPSHTYTANGTYNVTFQVNDATCGQTYTATKQVVISNCTQTCTYTLTSVINPIADTTVNDTGTTTVNFDGTNSVFDAVGSEPHKFYWMLGSADTTTAFSKNATSSQDFAFNGAGGNLPEGIYTVYLVINQGACLDTISQTFNVTHKVCTYTLTSVISTVADTTVNDIGTTTINFDGTNSVFDAVGSDPHKFYWMFGSADTTTAFSKNATSSKNFSFNGTGGNLPQGTYTVYLVINQGLCLDTILQTFNVTHKVCAYALDSKINAVADTTIDDTNPTVVNFNGTNSVFDAAGSEPHKYYWMIGSIDTTTSFSKNAASSLSFSLSGTGGNLPPGNYKVYLAINEGLCTNIDSVMFSVTHKVCTYNLNSEIAAVNDTTVNDVTPVHVSLNGGSSIFDAVGGEPHKFYWIRGSKDTSQAFATTPSASLTFAFGSLGGNLPEGAYTVYLVINQGLCTDIDSVSFGVFHDGCSGMEAKIVAVNEVVVDMSNPVTVDFSGITSIFPSGTKRYFWILGSADTTAAFSKDSVSSLSFSYNGKGGHNPNGSYEIYLVIKEGNCMDTVSSHLDVDYFFIPNLVTPNGDELNDQFKITNIVNRFDLEIYNRWGERIFMEKGYTEKWDLSKVHDGMYYYHVSDAHSDKKYKGWLHVIHDNL